MNRRYFGIGLAVLIIGLFLLMPLRITGAVIGFNTLVSQFRFLISLILILGGCGMIILSHSVHASPIDLDTILSAVKDKEVSLVFDTSGLDPFIKNGLIHELIDDQNKGKIFIPNAVINELGKYEEYGNIAFDSNVKNKKYNLNTFNKDIKKYTDLGFNFLKLTSKGRTYYELEPFFNEVLKKLKDVGERKFEIIEAIKSKYRDKVDNFDNSLDELEHLNIGQRTGDLVQKYSLMQHALRKNFKPSKTDAEVLGYSIYNFLGEEKKRKWKLFGDRGSSKGKRKPVGIVANDGDLFDAVEIMKTGYRGIDPETGNWIKLPKLGNIGEHIRYLPPKTASKINQEAEYAILSDSDR